MSLLHIFVLIIVYACTIEGYRTFSMKDLNSCSKSVEINISSMRQNSTGILVNAFDSTSYEPPGLHCEVILRPPLAYGVVVSIRAINLQPSVFNYANCENYLEISKIGRRDAVKLCGYSDDEYEFQSYINWGRTKIVFHTSDSTKIHIATFQLTFTAIRKGNNWCFGEERRCHNGHCIWKGLACDGHNNCGDASDELDKFISQCGTMSTGESLAVILVTIIGSLILLIFAAYLRGPKITQQIERLSADRSTNEQSVPTESENNENGNRVVATISSRNNYGSTTEGLLSPESYQSVMDDLPPSYEEVLGLPVNSTRNPTTDFLSRNIAAIDRPPVRRSFSTIDRNRNTVSMERPTTSIYRIQS